jgi:superfamily II DNA or RNA helicase
MGMLILMVKAGSLRNVRSTGAHIRISLGHIGSAIFLLDNTGYKNMNITINAKLIVQGIKDASHLSTIKSKLTLDNPKFQEAMKHGRYTGNIPENLYFYEESEKGLVMPRGFAYQLWKFLADYRIKPEFIDQRRVMPKTAVQFRGKLRDYQVQTVQDVLNRDFGLLATPTGSGKTAMACYLIAERAQPALIIVHSKELLRQWIDRIQQFLGIPADDIGLLGDGHFKVGSQVTVGMVQTLCNRAAEIVPHIGYLIADECHRAPAMQFAKVICQFDCKYMTGLSATPYRRDKLSKVIFFHLGDITGQLKDDLVKKGCLCTAIVHQISSDFVSDYSIQDEYSKGISDLAENHDRNQLIAGTIAQDTGSGIRLILSDRVQHLRALASLLFDKGISSETLTGSLKQEERLRVVDNLKAGKCKNLLATSQLIGEGFDLAEIESIFLTTPIRFSGRLVQYIGRALRPAPGKNKARVYDFVDVNEPVLAAQAEARLKTYEGQGFSILMING